MAAGEEVLVVGAGVVGASVAYHLTRLGHERVTVLDSRGPEALPGSTGLAPGFVGQLSATPELAVLAKDSVATYRALSAAADEPAFWQVGCLEVATTEERLAQAHQDVAHGRGLGIEARVLDAAEAVALAPALVDAGRALGALHIPSDGAADPAALTRLLVAAAESAGARFRWRTPVQALEADRGRLVGVRTGTTGELLRADRVVLATGIWGPVLAAGVGVRLPMVDVQHPYVFTAERPELDDTPIDAPISCATPTTPSTPAATAAATAWAATRPRSATIGASATRTQGRRGPLRGGWAREAAGPSAPCPVRRQPLAAAGSALSGREWRNSASAALNSSGRSRFGRWPACSMTDSVASGTRAWMSRASLTGV
ncbi:FAD dependent oxidoreductase [Streptomyces sp. SceaMP-e96]|nr:FAD dependent oxidoreductase [Streptomyces sp. SceaMP-e96]